MKKIKKNIYLGVIFIILILGILALKLNDKNIVELETNISNIGEENKKIPVLMYHHFTEDKEEKTSEIVHTSEFKKQMKYLSDNGYTAITTKELLEILSGQKNSPKKPILITADDGYLSNYEYMYPILKENNLKATIFLIGQRIDNADTSTVGLPKINWTQAKEMYESGVIDFQSHTYDSHNMVDTREGERGDFSAPLVDESDEEYRKRIDTDIKMSIKGFEENLGYSPSAFAYPFGHYSNISEEILKENNIKLSFTVEPGYINKEDNGYLLKRINVHGDYTIDEFIQKLDING